MVSNLGSEYVQTFRAVSLHVILVLRCFSFPLPVQISNVLFRLLCAPHLSDLRSDHKHEF